MSAAYSVLADRLGEAHVQLGEIAVRLELARGRLARLRHPAGRDPATTAQPGSPRDVTLTRLRTAIQRFEAASPADRPGKMAEVRDLVDHVDQLDRWEAALNRSTIPLVGLNRVADLERTLTALERRHELQDCILSRAAVTVAAQLRDLPRELEQLALLHQSYGALPHRAIDQLRRETDAMLAVVGELNAARLEVAGAPSAPAETTAADAAVQRRAACWAGRLLPRRDAW